MVCNGEVFENKHVEQLVERYEDLKQHHQYLIETGCSTRRIEQKLRGKCLIEHFQDHSLHELLEIIRQKENSCLEIKEQLGWFILGSCPRAFLEKTCASFKERMRQIEVCEFEGRCKKFVQERSDIPPTQMLLALINVVEEAVRKEQAERKKTA